MSGFPNLGALQAQAAPMFLAGANFANITASVNTQVKAGAAALCGITVNTAGTTSACALYDGISATVSITIATPGVVSWTGHPFAIGGAIKFTTTGALPTGLTANTTYYVSSAGFTGNTFRLAPSLSDALAGTNTINTSGSQSGVHTGWDVSRKIATFTTTAQANLPIGVNGVQCPNGIIAITTDGGAAADITVSYL